ncbi:hypothetical protein FACS1894133_2660 [Clostridia bacterium]|nr:hypothetical protein FACS1894133_2660 [Clostridia bacterium]
MSTIGIIAEYNPFHNGHAFHVGETRAKTGADTIVAIMSGNFTQRGEVAILDKYERAAVALNYVDMVAELPVAYSLGSAHTFAAGAVRLAAALSCDGISFGSECGDIALLKEAAGAAFYSEQKEDFFSALKRGMTYPAALSYVVGRYYGEEVTAVFARPNDTLAVEYIKAVDIHAPGMEVYAVKRYGASHGSDTVLSGDSGGGYASGSYVRKMIVNGVDTGGFAPVDYRYFTDTAAVATQTAQSDTVQSAQTARVLKWDTPEDTDVNVFDEADVAEEAEVTLETAAVANYVTEFAGGTLKTAGGAGITAGDRAATAPAAPDYAHIVRLEKAILAFYRAATAHEIENYQCLTRELSNRIISAARLARNLNELLCLAKTKCYTMARIRRAVMCGFLRLNKCPVNPPYIHILGMNGRGKALLKNASLPADTSLMNLSGLSDTCKQFARTEARCGDIYALCFSRPRPSGGDYRAKPVIM